MRMYWGWLVPLFLAAVPAVWAQPPPALVGEISFDDAPVGTGIAKDRYRSQGIILDCTPGHWLYLVQRDGPSGRSGRSLAVSPGEPDLYIGVRFVVPGSTVRGAVQRTDMTALDGDRRGYDYEYSNTRGVLLTSGSNHGDYHIGDGWYYSDGTEAHRFVLHVGDGQHVFLDDVRFSAISGNNSLAVVPFTWSAVRLLYK